MDESRPLKHNGAAHLFGYKAATGTVKFMKFNANAQGVQTLGEEPGRHNRTAFSPLLIDGDAHILAYKAGSGAVQDARPERSGLVISTIWAGAWTKGWA